MPRPATDVLVVGGGPAGRALAAECGLRGLRTLLVDPAPDAPWRVTYGCWAGELPPGLPASVVAATVRGRATALTHHDLGWDYAVLDVPALRAHLDSRLGHAGVTVTAGRVAGWDAPGTVALADGSHVHAAVVVDAGGRRQPLRTAPEPGPGRPSAEQTAFGVVVEESAAAPVVTPGTALFMDWRRDHGEPGWPTFLYAVPLGGGAVLLEETSLARRPALPVAVLRRRLFARLAARGVTPQADAPVERVRFPVDSPRHRTPGVLGFGAAAPLVHPATGFSVATSLTLAPAVADAVAAHLPAGPRDALAAAEAAVWPTAARAVHRLRRVGLEALLRMPPAEVPGFFEVFLGLPERHRWAYLTGRGDLRGMVSTMNALFGRADWRLRRRLVGPALRPPAPAVPDEAAPTA
ncbi:lycopene cyclase family protein [Pseudonocardia xinjiangensis]|uniref:Lycopene cyclase family protein n=1 Tax=Pseudonocardia xinjiangensis TaxID=75289 RepID=A0ABX1RR52_9PSEU|nr:lycopene cyclase family protein [Pseudonocardia xinjiangensis]NMH82009.1 lycopene cyclase family protein [Pseudonocardia xinjiangensis]